jgi:hypothetical protein
MNVSTKSEYGLRALIYLADNRQDRAIPAREIAEKWKVPIKYLEQILKALKEAGMIEGQVAIALNKQVAFNIYSTFRFGRNITHLVDRRLGVGFTFKAGKYLTLAPNYLNIVTRPFEGRRGNENRLTFAGTLRFPLGKKYTLSDRNQVERRLRSTGNSTRYRNRIQLEHPVKFGKTPLTLFASEEVFYDWSVNDWVRNRFAVGVSHKFNAHFTGDLILHATERRARPSGRHSHHRCDIQDTPVVRPALLDLVKSSEKECPARRTTPYPRRALLLRWPEPVLL